MTFLHAKHVNWTSGLPISGPKPTLNPFKMFVKYILNNNQRWKTVGLLHRFLETVQLFEICLGGDNNVFGAELIRTKPHELDTFTSYVTGKQVIQMCAQTGRLEKEQGSRY